MESVVSSSFGNVFFRRTADELDDGAIVAFARLLSYLQILADRIPLLFEVQASETCGVVACGVGHASKGWQDTARSVIYSVLSV